MASKVALAAIVAAVVLLILGAGAIGPYELALVVSVKSLDRRGVQRIVRIEKRDDG